MTSAQGTIALRARRARRTVYVAAALIVAYYLAASIVANVQGKTIQAACARHGGSVGGAIDNAGPPYRMLLFMRPIVETTDCADGTSFAVNGDGTISSNGTWK